MEGDINEARGTLMEVAQDAILGCLNSKDERVRLDAAKFTLKTLGKEKGWSENPNFAVNIQIEDSERDKKIRAIFGLSECHEVLEEDKSTLQIEDRVVQ